MEDNSDFYKDEKKQDSEFLHMDELFELLKKTKGAKEEKIDKYVLSFSEDIHEEMEMILNQDPTEVLKMLTDSPELLHTFLLESHHIPSEILLSILESQTWPLSKEDLLHIVLEYGKDTIIFRKALEHPLMDDLTLRELITEGALSLDHIKLILEMHYSDEELPAFIFKKVFISKEIYFFFKKKIAQEELFEILYNNESVSKDTYHTVIYDILLPESKRKDFLFLYITLFAIKQEEYDDLLSRSNIVLNFNERMHLEKMYQSKKL